MAPPKTILAGLKERVKAYQSDADFRLIERAVDLASEALKERASEKLAPSVDVAGLLADLRLGEKTLAAELVQPCLLEGTLDRKRIEAELGREAADLAWELAKTNVALAEGNPEKTGRLLLALTHDFRLVLMALTERRVLLERTLRAKADARDLASEVLENYAPLAEKLGVYSLRCALEDMAFKALHPEQYLELESRLRQSEKSRERELETAIETLSAELARTKIEARVESRFKHLYGTYSKMKRKGIPLEQVYDLNAVRVITHSLEACYTVLGIVHALWKPIPDQFDDYIAKPKQNYYQSLHTAVLSGKGMPFEVQIRTEEMHNFAEYGVAAHWRYKGAKEAKHHDQKLELIRQVIHWAAKADGSTPTEGMKVQLFGNQINVFTPKGDTISLCRGATALDFAYAIHSDLGNKAYQVKINGKLASLEHELSAGDTVEILTSAKQTPKRAWLAMAKTEKARKKIMQAIHLQKGAAPPSPIQGKGMAIKITGKQKNVKLAGCCKPLPSDRVVGYRTTKRKLIVHSVTCQELAKQKELGRLVNVDWGKRVGGKYSLELKVFAADRPSLLVDLLNVISGEKANVKAANTKTSSKGTALSVFVMEHTDMARLEKIVEGLKRIRGVKEVTLVGS
ncbi:MAG TPA: bifunctional (p)ppGpp synthetase/guanosine-3',5'-bis(diphosphate) 3'-pyrophosphohydrolase [Candidatus Diapherotrites archaeon]|uniref:Bifunctional (P)ppGpp synthetase/guanosine-3',5'-bis(Diphosphate) 3'-pyrophosphohydrolase n=1 Tax=Candidatus Iainarchaeum sp. TaxID=3101447 RepID=A0A7J4JER4_9ARCH|nr:bifunctional (p)ppGpp synthetase/guanosine-3',5'-bis(diphosphate) 3'-pyrophosphohydrolase [Candidatus Diapherotrites archaeon]HIH16208.1 bifunctional (p)ppGpp synthetase/guanosine-3',5'-bis(diphosphate) 3'-pyrophosphohydrolase [Candidatus Diapherotrites archaeon]